MHHHRFQEIQVLLVATVISLTHRSALADEPASARAGASGSPGAVSGSVSSGAVEEVHVNGRRVKPSRGSSDFRIPRAVLQAAPHATGADLLATAPGIYVAHPEGDAIAQRIYLRGFDAEHGQELVRLELAHPPRAVATASASRRCRASAHAHVERDGVPMTLDRWVQRLSGLLLAGAAGAACLEEPQQRLEDSAVAVASGRRSIEVGGWTITLDRAALAFGPAYFCAAKSGSSTLCESAVAEIITIARIDGLSPAPFRFGRVEGLTGHIESVSYDLGILWLDTQQAPSPAPEAPNGHSIELAGVATKGTLTIPFVGLVDALPQFQGQHAVATAPAVGDVESSDVVLEVYVDPIRWLAQVDFDAASSRPERPLVFASGTPEHSAILVGLKRLAPIEFHWSRNHQ